MSQEEETVVVTTTTTKKDSKDGKKTSFLDKLVGPSGKNKRLKA